MVLDVPSTFGPYRVVARLGRGGMGVVYRAVDTRADREVALKVMLPEATSDENARVRFVREGQAITGLQHRNIVTVHDCGILDDAPYIAMELLSGVSLAARLAGNEPLTLDATLNIVIQLCEGLQFAHDSGVVHRDVKPANVWLLGNGGVKLLDFGIAKFAGSTLTLAGRVVGSAAYMSPEQLAGTDVDGRSDIFAAGAILYELLAGRRAFEAESLTAVMHKILHEAPPYVRTFAADLPADVELALETALQKDVSQRYEQAADFAADLRLARYQRAQPVESTVVAQRPALQHPPVSHPTLHHASPPHPIVAPASQSQTGGAARALDPPAPPAPPPAPSPSARSHHERPSLLITARSAIVRLSPALRRSAPWLGAIAAVVVIVMLVARSVPQSSPAPVIQVDVKSTPPGAAVILDGRATGQITPATFSLAARPARIALALRGFEAVDASIPSSAASGPLELTYTLRRLLKIRSAPAGARIVIDGRDTGLTTPADLTMSDPAPSLVELRLNERTRRSTQVTPAVLASGELHVTFTTTPSAAAGRQPAVAPRPGADVPAALPGTPLPAAAVSVRVTGGYPFEVSGCGTTSRPASDHELQVNAPCTLRLRAPAYFLDTARSIAASAGRVEIAAPQLARVQLRSRYEWCTVILAGHAVGSPPVDLELVAGTYTATIQCPDKTFSTHAFSIDPGRSIRRLDEFLR